MSSVIATATISKTHYSATDGRDPSDLGELLQESFRIFQIVLAERGLDISYEAVRR
jgi:hypothetical protein